MKPNKTPRAFRDWWSRPELWDQTDDHIDDDHDRLTWRGIVIGVGCGLFLWLMFIAAWYAWI